MNPLNSNTEAPVFKAPSAPVSATLDDDSIIWTEPVLFEESRPPNLPVESLPEWLANYVTAVSQSTQSPPEMSVMISLAILATCLQGKVHISPHHGDYSEPVNLWTIVALPPSSRKSAVFKAFTAPLIKWEKTQEVKQQPLIDAAETEKVVNQKRINDLQAQAAKEKDKTVRKELIAEITELKEGLDQEIHLPRLFSGDITAEELQNLMLKQNERMSILADEGGIFKVMTGLYNSGKANLDVFLQSYTGSSVRVNRGQRTVVMDSPALTFGLTVQPSVIEGLCQGDNKELRGLGALARFLYAVPVSNVGSRDVRKSISIDPGIKAVYEHNIETLLNLRAPVNSDGKETLQLTLSTEALDTWYNFAQEIEDKQGPGGEFEQICDFTGKLPGTALRIAALLHCADHWFSLPVVSVKAMQRAIDLCRPLITHAMLAFDLMAVDPTLEDAKFIYQWIREQNSNRFIKSNLRRSNRFRRADKERLERALEVLIERGIISDLQKLNTRKPTLIYMVNPRVAPPPDSL